MISIIDNRKDEDAKVQTLVPFLDMVSFGIGLWAAMKGSVMIAETEKRTAIACKICGNTTRYHIYHAREMMFGLRDEFDYLECLDCRCVQLLNPPLDMGKYYPAEYYSLSDDPVPMFSHPIRRMLKGWRTHYAVTNQGVIGKVLYERTPDTLARSLAPIAPAESARILDVGCGSGIFLYALRNAGFTQTMGVDPFIAAPITYPNGLTVLKQELHTVTGNWDVIMLHHAFEHVPDPLETLRAIERLLAPDGTCLIRIPTSSSYAWRHYRADWVQLDAPRHYFLHSVESLRLLARRAGLRVDAIQYDSYELQFWGSEQYRRNIPLHDPRSYKIDPEHSVFSSEEIAAFRLRSEELNQKKQGDQAAFYLKKV